MIRNLSDHKSELARPLSESKYAFEKPGFLLPNKQNLSDLRLTMQDAFSWFSIAHPEVLPEHLVYAQKRLEASFIKDREFFLAQAVMKIISEARVAELWVPHEFAQRVIEKEALDQAAVNFISQFNQRAESEIYFIVDKDQRPRSMLRKKKHSTFLTYTYFEQSGDWVIGFDYQTKTSLSMVSPVNIDEYESQLRDLLVELGFRGGQTIIMYDYTDGISFKNILRSNKQIDIFI